MVPNARNTNTLLPHHYTGNTRKDKPISMSWMGVAVICCLLPLLHGQSDCTQRIRWREMLDELNNLNSNISPDCGHDIDNTALCNPREMLEQIKYSPEVVLDIMVQAQSLYEKISNSQKVVEMVQNTCEVLTSCAQHPAGPVPEPVTTCFGKLEAFLNNKKSCPRCAGEIANIMVREILQRLQNRTQRPRRRRR